MECTGDTIDALRVLDHVYRVPHAVLFLVHNGPSALLPQVSGAWQEPTCQCQAIGAEASFFSNALDRSEGQDLGATMAGDSPSPALVTTFIPAELL